MNPTTAYAALAARRSKKRPRVQRVDVDVGVPVGSGKTTWVELRGKTLGDRCDGVVVTSNTQTEEDQRLLTVAGALDADRIIGVEAGACPHTAIREDASIKLEVIDRRLEKFPAADIVFIESGADKLAATFSPELSALTNDVIAVAAGEKIPRNSGPGSTKSDWFVINKTDLARCVDADLAVIEADTQRMRPAHAGRRPYLMTQLKTRDGLAEVLRLIERRSLLVEA